MGPPTLSSPAHHVSSRAKFRHHGGNQRLLACLLSFFHGGNLACLCGDCALCALTHGWEFQSCARCLEKRCHAARIKNDNGTADVSDRLGLSRNRERSHPAWITDKSRIIKNATHEHAWLALLFLGKALARNLHWNCMLALP